MVQHKFREHSALSNKLRGLQLKSLGNRHLNKLGLLHFPHILCNFSFTRRITLPKEHGDSFDSLKANEALCLYCGQLLIVFLFLL